MLTLDGTIYSIDVWETPTRVVATSGDFPGLVVIKPTLDDLMTTMPQSVADFRREFGPL